MIKQVELLAPCGSYDSFLAAVNAGADAVYLGGRQFGARAYAENFSEDGLIKVIREAHLFGVKVYLTVNTLVKEQEFSGFYSYMLPLYKAGLDGVIVQDMGVFCFLRENFPGLKLHASTQMTITGKYGAAYLKELGCERIVPARELSLQEIEEIKREVPVEIEVFIHGAMCYCYSGQCLMSSMIGGRSGNRGRCAGPCRLPYRAEGKEGYYLSLKDMNTLEHIPELIEAGIDSFKIEGRMKKPEYVAGVVSIYRKYIDRYYREMRQERESSQECSGIAVKDRQRRTFSGRGERSFQVEPKDKKLLSSLYIRSETGNGYYEKKNGRDMLTLHKPGYNEADQALLDELREKYIHELPKVQVRFLVRCRVGEPLYGEVRLTDQMSGKTGGNGCGTSGKEGIVSGGTEGKEVCLSVAGDIIEKADKRAVSGEEIRGQLVKTGGTSFAVKECIVEAGENVFVPMGRIKTLRRELLQRIYAYYGDRNLGELTSGGTLDDRRRKVYVETEPGEEKDTAASGRTETAEQNVEYVEDENRNLRTEEGGKTGEGKINEKGNEKKGYSLTILVQTRRQFEAAFSAMDSSASEFSNTEKDRRTGGEAAETMTGETVTEYLVVDADLFLEEKEIQERLSAGRVHWGIKCPVILRKNDEDYLERLRAAIEERKPEIVYCATVDAFAWVKSIFCSGKIAGEASLYAWNRKAVSFWGSNLERVSIPLELESREIRELCSAVHEVDRMCQNSEKQGMTEWTKKLAEKLEVPVYGRAPFMVSANCIKLSTGSCDKNRRRYTELTDRLGNVFPVYTNCSHCYNIIYNHLPTSYYEGLWMLLEDGIRAFRMEFTTESGRETAETLQTFRQFFASELRGRGVGGTASGRDRRNGRNAGRAESDRGNSQSSGASGQKKGKTAGAETTQGRFRRSVE